MVLFLPVGLEVELLKALAKDPDARHPSVSAFRAAVAMAVDQSKKTIPLASHHLEAAVTAAATATSDESAVASRGISVLGYLVLVALLATTSSARKGKPRSKKDPGSTDSGPQHATTRLSNAKHSNERPLLSE